MDRRNSRIQRQQERQAEEQEERSIPELPPQQGRTYAVTPDKVGRPALPVAQLLLKKTGEDSYTIEPEQTSLLVVFAENRHRGARLCTKRDVARNVTLPQYDQHLLSNAILRTQSLQQAYFSFPTAISHGDDYLQYFFKDEGEMLFSPRNSTPSNFSFRTLDFSSRLKAPEPTMASRAGVVPAGPSSTTTRLGGSIMFDRTTIEDMTARKNPHLFSAAAAKSSQSNNHLLHESEDEDLVDLLLKSLCY